MENDYILSQKRLKSVFDKCFDWALANYGNLEEDVFGIVTSELKELLWYTDTDDPELLSQLKIQVETAIKEPLTKYVCEVGGDGESDLAWEWITNKKKKYTTCGWEGYLEAALYDKGEKTVGKVYPINSVDVVEEPYEPNITMEIYRMIRKQYKPQMSKKKLVEAIKNSIDDNIISSKTVPELIEKVISSVAASF